MTFSISFIVAGLAAFPFPIGVSAALSKTSARTHDNAPSVSSIRQLQLLRTINLDQVGPPIFGTPANVRDRGQVLFGSSVFLSSDGSRLLVGAPSNDFDKNGLLAQNSGSVSLYSLNGQLQWDLLWSLHGDVGEGIGEYLSMNNAGTLVAVRRTNSQAHSVQVYNPYTGNLVGSPISCRNQGSTTIFSDFVALSPEGQRIALNCRTSFGRVQIFDLVQDNWQPIGELNGAAAQNLFGFSFSFAGSGNRIAISSPNHDTDSFTNVGLVQVFDYVGGDWTQVGQNVLGLAAFNAFGFALDLSHDGSTLVVTAPSADGGFGQNAGHARTLVYDPSTQSWTPFGGLVGGQPQDRFGRTVSISADGTRFIASSWTSSSSRGYAILFERQNGRWAEIASVTGNAVGDRLGFGRSGIYLTPDGTQLVAGEAWTNDPGQSGASTGRVFVLKTPPPETNIDAPSTVTPINSLGQAPSATPNETPSAIQTARPSLASSTAEPNTRTASPSPGPAAHVPGPSTGAPTPPPISASSSPPTCAPTSSPTDAPTAKPKTDATSSSSPSGVTSSSSPTAAGSMDTFDYDIQRNGAVDVEFSDERSDMEIILTYNINNNCTALVRIFQEDCVTSVSNTTIGINATTIPYSPTHATLTVMLDVIQDTVVNSPIYETIDAEAAVIAICIRVDLLTNGGTFHGESIVFHESVVFVHLDLTNAFQTTITLEGDEVDTHTSSVHMHYGIEACHCDNTYQCLAVGTAVTQDSVVNICLSSPDRARDVFIANVLDVELQQGTLTNVAVQHSTTNPFTQVKLLPNGSAVVTTFIPVIFFEQPDPLPISVSGIVSLSFHNGPDDTRSLHATEDEKANFGLTLHVLNGSSTASKPMATVLTAVVVLAASAWLL